MSIHIETPRLIVRTPVIADVSMIQDEKDKVWPQLQLWMSWAYPGEETLEATQRFIERAESRGFLIGLCKHTGKFVISTGITPCEDQEGVYETGYWVARDFLGKGYATEATNAVIRYGFNALNAAKIYICHYEGNVASRRVIEKLGFKKTGVREKAHARCLDGMLLDVHDYIMTDPEVLPALEVEWRRRCP